MFKDSNSPQTDLQCLQRWLALPETKEVLEHLEVASQSLLNLIVEVLPNSMEATHLREQSIGEVRGLRHLGRLTESRLSELVQTVDELKKRAESEAVPQIDESSTPTSATNS